MQIRSCVGLALGVFVSHAVVAEPVVLHSPVSMQESAFTDRSAPGTYQYDSGPATTGWYLGGSSPTKEILGIHKFSAASGSDLIQSISCAWAGVANGSPARVFVWQDDGSGNLSNARLITEQAVTVQNSGTAIFNVYSLTVPAPVRGTFYIGFSVIHGGISTAVLPFQGNPNPPYVAGRAYVGGTTAGPLVASNLATIGVPLSEVSLTGYFLLRAGGSASSFSYQGRLNRNGSSYTGVADARFTIFDSATGGASVAPVFEQQDVPVTGGVFTLQIPAQPAWFAGAAERYLQVEVRTAEDGGAFVPLTPREQIGQVPGAMVATLAQNALGAQSVPWSGITGAPANVTNAFSPWSSVGAGISYSAGSVGIGTSSPTYSLHVTTPSSAAGLLDSSHTVGTWLTLRNQSGGGQLWNLISTGSGNSEGTGNLLFLNSNSSAKFLMTSNGRFGVNTSAPEQTLSVNGNAQILTGSGFLTSGFLAFGGVGDKLATAEGSDFVAFQRVNASTNVSELRLIIGDDPTSNAASADYFTIGSIPSGVWSPAFQFRTDGLASKPGGGTWATISDPKTKHGASRLRGTLDRLLLLNGYQYFYNENEIRSGRALPGLQIGLMADEVERVFPDWVTRDRDGMRMVTERSTTALMVEALRDLRAEKDEQIRQRDARIEALEERLKRLEAAMERAAATAR